MDEIKEKSLTKEILGWVVYIVIVIILTYLVITFVGVRTKVEGRSMENTLPGETVQVIDGYVYIDGEKLDEDYGKEVMETSGIAQEPIKLGEDEYFVLGDNRNHSADSRDASVGVLKREDLVGRAWVRIWPLDSIGVVKHD